MPGDHEQKVFIGRIRHTHPRRVHVDTALEVEPVSAGMKAQPFPALVCIELTDQRQQAVLGGIEVTAQFG